MTYQEYYGEDLPRLQSAEKTLLDLVRGYPAQDRPDGLVPILYCKSRIKRPESMMAKLRLRGLETDASTALEKMHDGVGIRVVCSFLEDVYQIASWLKVQNGFSVQAEKDYIAHPKPNGYRSLHLILRFSHGLEAGITAEVQLRTIVMDSWAALEHQIKYKKSIRHEKTIRDERKRCADEIASVDLSMETLRDLILGGKWE